MPAGRHGYANPFGHRQAFPGGPRRGGTAAVGSGTASFSGAGNRSSCRFQHGPTGGFSQLLAPGHRSAGGFDDRGSGSFAVLRVRDDRVREDAGGPAVVALSGRPGRRPGGGR